MSEPADDALSKTELAEDRTILANERTFAGWIRTGLASIGVGVGFSALFRTMEPDWLPRAIATAFLFLGAWIVVAAERRACAVIAKMSPNYVKVSRPLNLRVMAVVAVLATTALTVAIWVVPIRD